MGKFKTFLPVFPGFYESLFESDETQEIDEINMERSEKRLPEIDYSDCIFDYADYRNRVANKCCEEVESELKDYIGDCSITFENIYSPRFYNYTNDSINIEVELDLNRVLKYLNENEEEFFKYIKEKFTSRDGFISLFSNYSEDWIKYLKEGYKSTTVIGTVLEFILKNEEFEHDSLYERVVEECYISVVNHDELIGDKSIETARAAWGRLGDIPINEEEEIDETFKVAGFTFEKGTERTDVWHFFERYFNLSVAEDLMFVK